MSGFPKLNSWEHNISHDITLSHVAKKYGVKVSHLRDSNRNQVLVSKRVKVARDLRGRGMTLQQIGDLLDRDHSTILHYINHEVY